MGRIYVTQNDNKNDNKINPKAIFKHHGPLITLPLITSQPPQQTQLASQLAKATESTSQPMPTPALETTSQPKDIKKRSSSKHVVATCGYGEFAPRSVFAAKVWMPEVNGSWTNDFLDGGRMCINLFDCDKCR